MTVTHCHATCIDVIFDLSPTSWSSSLSSSLTRTGPTGRVLLRKELDLRYGTHPITLLVGPVFVKVRLTETKIKESC